jgi:hypothetical protein
MVMMMMMMMMMAVDEDADCGGRRVKRSLKIAFYSQDMGCSHRVQHIW